MATDIQLKLKDWATTTYDKYVEIAQTYDVAFYQQTPLNDLTDNVKVVVLGINPGSAGTYTDQKNNPAWEMHRDNFLLNGNKPSWGERYRWRFIQNLCRLFGTSQLDDREVVITNTTFFSTPKANQLFDSIVDKTVESSIELIDILNPGFVLCLGGANCFNRLRKHYGDKFTSEDVYGNALKIGSLNGRVYLGIYHPSYHYPAQLTELVKKAIQIVSRNSTQSPETIKSMLLKECAPEWDAYIHRPRIKSVSNDKARKVLEILLHSDRILPSINKRIESPSHDGNLIFDINDHIIAKYVVQKSKQYILWIHSNYYNKKSYRSFADEYPLTGDILELLQRYGFERPDNLSNLGEKPISAYGIADEASLAEAVADDINTIAEEVNALFSFNNIPPRQ